MSKWIPKPGDYVVSKTFPSLVLRVVSISMNGERFWSDRSDPFGELLDCYRPITAEELSSESFMRGESESKKQEKMFTESQMRELMEDVEKGLNDPRSFVRLVFGMSHKAWMRKVKEEIMRKHGITP